MKNPEMWYVPKRYARNDDFAARGFVLALDTLERDDAGVQDELFKRVNSPWKHVSSTKEGPPV